MGPCSFTQMDRIEASRGECGASTKTDRGQATDQVLRCLNPRATSLLFFLVSEWVCVHVYECRVCVSACVSEHVPKSVEKPEEDIGGPVPSLSALSPRDRVSHLDLDWQLAHPRIPLVSESTAPGL